MSSVISSIEKIYDDLIGREGYRIQTTNKGYIHINISNSQNCCESWYTNALKNKQNVDGVLDEMIGKKIVDIQKSDVTVDEDTGYDEFAYFVNITITFENDEFPLIICLYNQHNGFYRHECMLDWNVTIDKKSFVLCETVYI